MRKLQCGIVEAICKYTEDTEVPAIFSVWAGISAVGAAMGRDCFVDQGYFAIYPNLYVILVAGSARCRKSTAVNIAGDFIQKVVPKINLISQKVTPEGLIGMLSGLIGDEGATTVVPSAVGVAVVDELSTLIDKNAFKSGLIALLTNLYDCKDFEYLTRGRGRELVNNPCLSVLGASTIRWIKDTIPEVAIGGGFTSRIVFVYKDKREKLVPWPVMSAENKALSEDIVHDLCEVSKMRGPIALDKGALDTYKEEYVNFYENSSLMKDEGLAGYANRRHHILLKVSMIICASRTDNRLITQHEMNMSIKLLRKAENAMPFILRTIMSEKVGTVFESILTFIISMGSVGRPRLIREFRHKMTSQDLDVLLRTLEEEGVILQTVDGSKIVYTYTGKGM
ncbi:hypothetical protein LCGC14_1270810 [marine sediment metagenome]|uniref:MCM domain-containing protein n=1 Tax=marine sediment metagenome TaxID=412755 RepID=A0A0F9L004_9ZZZZ